MLFLDKKIVGWWVVPVDASSVVVSASSVSFPSAVSEPSSPNSFCVPWEIAYRSNATLSIGDISVASSPCAGVLLSLASSCGLVEDSLVSSVCYNIF